MLHNTNFTTAFIRKEGSVLWTRVDYLQIADEFITVSHSPYDMLTCPKIIASLVLKEVPCKVWYLIKKKEGSMMVVLRMGSLCLKISLQIVMVMPHGKLQEFRSWLTGREDALAAEADGQLGTATSSAVPSQATLQSVLLISSHHRAGVLVAGTIKSGCFCS